MIIRPIDESDVEEISQVFVACFSAPPWNEAWTAVVAHACISPKLQAQSSRGYVAIINNSVVGAAFGQIEGGLNRNKFQLQEFFVLPSAQRQGIGKNYFQHYFLSWQLLKMSALFISLQAVRVQPKIFTKNSVSQSVKK